MAAPFIPLFGGEPIRTVSTTVSVSPLPNKAVWRIVTPSIIVGAVTATASLVVANWSIPVVVTSGTITTALNPVVANWTIVSPTIVLTNTTALPILTANWSVGIPQVLLTVTAITSPVTANWQIPTAVAQAGTVTATTIPVVADWSIPPVAAVNLNTAIISPVTASWVTLKPDVANVIFLTPFGPAWTVVTVTVSTGDLQTNLQPVTATWSIPQVTVVAKFAAIHFVNESMEVHRFVEEEMLI